VPIEGSWAIIVHGGAKEIKPEEEDDNRAGILQAVEAGRSILASGGSALDAVESAIRVMEDLPVFNAGHGSAKNAAGEVEMCAGLMDGRDLSVGSVAVIREVRHPIGVAREVMPEKEILIAGEGALLFAKERGLELASGDELASAEPAAQEHDTVGAVAFDTQGNFAAGTSTGGLDGSRVGRVGDSPLPGAGLYADNHIGAVSLSGDGESIARLTLASRIMARINEDGPERAIADAVQELPGVGGGEADGGAIAIAKDGRLGWGHNSPHFAVALVTDAMNEPCAWLRKEAAGAANG
jgi:beta-aspartyl-peptidase (threonine type)